MQQSASTWSSPGTLRSPDAALALEPMHGWGITLRIQQIRVPLAFLTARAVAGLLYATAAFDPVAYGMAVGVLVVVSALAAYVPARRASRLDPMTALRTE